MWTPRRVLLLILGMVLFGTAFGVYARFLGWIDGLPELPDELLVRRAADEVPADVAVTPVEAKLQQAFGADCLEATNRYNIKLELRAKGIVLAAGDFGIDPEGRVRFWPFSLATFRDRPGQYPEINTVHADVAYLEFDRPVRSVAEMASRRIVGCELVSDPHDVRDDPRQGQVTVANNRGTPELDDDLLLETPGPLVYRESAQPNLPLDKALPQLRTTATVKMIDRRQMPEATTVTAQGMDVYLVSDPSEHTTPAAKKAKPKANGSAVSGVRRVVLPANVDMSLWMDPKEGFLAAGAKPQAPKLITGPVAEKPVERNHVLITTRGPFTYDVLPDGDLARFDRLPPAATQLPDCVRVVRPMVRGPDAQLNDQLECDSLELHFAAKPPPAAPGTKPPAKVAKEEDRQSVDWVHAWGQFIVLTSDAEKLVAHGNDLFHDTRSKATTIKGVPETVAVKDGHEIHAPELVMYGAESKTGKQAEGRGAGYFRLVDNAGSKRTVEARWRDLMVYRQEAGRDLLTLTGDGLFEDRANDQKLRGDQIKLWLAPAAKATDGPAPKPSPDAAGPPKLHPERLEATGHVSAKSPELTIHDTDQLVLLFKDLPPLTGPVPPGKPGGSPWSTPVTPVPAPTPGPPAAAVARPTPPPQKKPIDLTARSVQAFVNRQGELNLLDTVHCEGEVRVHQDPVPPQEKPVDMRGRTLKLKHTAAGDVLTVTGTVDVLAEVHTPDLSLIGPFIVIDQVENTADVQGVGSMRMASTTDFEGKKLKEPAPMIITWKQGMKFTGQHARFHGFVQANQQDTTCLCQTMQVYLNRPVSLSQRQGGVPAQSKEAANVDKVVCEAGDQPQGVIITETLRDPDNGRMTSTRRVEADEVAIYKEEGRMDAANHRNARGNVRIVQLGPKGEPPGARRPAGRQPAAPPVRPAEQEWKLTWVRYNGTMKVNNQTRVAEFFDGVEVLHVPLEAPDRQPGFDSTVNKLPAGAMHLQAVQMRVYSAKDANGQTRQEMEAKGKAKVTWGTTFYGTADVIRFDESKQLMKLEGQNGGYATAIKLDAQTGAPSRVVARSITYNRQTDEIISDGVYSITGK